CRPRRAGEPKACRPLKLSARHRRQGSRTRQRQTRSPPSPAGGGNTVRTEGGAIPAWVYAFSKQTPTCRAPRRQRGRRRRTAPPCVSVAAEVRANRRRTSVAQDGSDCALFCATADCDTRAFRASRASVVDGESYIF